MNLDQSNYCTHLSESNVDDESLQSLEAVARSYEQLTTQKTAREMVYMRRKQVTGIGAEQRRVNLNPIGGAPSRGKESRVRDEPRASELLRFRSERC